MIMLLLLLLGEPVAFGVIYFNNGDTLNVNMVEVNSEEMKYSYVGEELVNVQPLNYLVDRVVLRSGREIKSPKRLMNNYPNFLKVQVIITREPRDVIGLKATGRGKGMSGWGGKAKKMGRSGAENSLRKQAFKRGAFIVLIQDENTGMTTQAEGVFYKLPPAGTFTNNPTSLVPN